jgi:hypothetical protein
LKHDVDFLFKLPLSTQAAIQLEELLQTIDNFHWDDNINDRWTYSWGNSKYSSKKAYKLFSGTVPDSPLFPWLWSSSNLGKHKFFFWLLLRDRLSTRNLLRRKNMQLDDYSCVLCNTGHEEISFHLFFECPFNIACWNTMPINCNLNLPHLDMVIEARTNFGSNIFRDIYIAACWVIWITRNEVIFFIMGRSILISGKEDSRKILDLCVRNPMQVGKYPSIYGKIVTLPDFVPFLLGLDALYLLLYLFLYLFFVPLFSCAVHSFF